MSSFLFLFKDTTSVVSSHLHLTDDFRFAVHPIRTACNYHTALLLERLGKKENPTMCY